MTTTLFLLLMSACAAVNLFFGFRINFTKQHMMGENPAYCFFLKTSEAAAELLSVVLKACVLFVSAGVVLQPGLAWHGVLPRCGQQRHPEGKSARRTGPPPVRHLCVQSPPESQQGAALLCGNVSHETETGLMKDRSGS